MCAVFNKERELAAFDKLIPLRSQSSKNQIAIEGLYLFGGIKPEDSDKNLYVLKTGKKTQWKIIKTTGPQPEARSHHQLQYLQGSGLLLLIGGRRVVDISTQNKEVPMIVQSSHWVDSILTEHWNQAKKPEKVIT